MIVTRKQAEEACTLLELDMDQLTEDAIAQAYRAKAKVCHPDAGGTIAAFAAVDRAKHILTHWLTRRAIEEPIPAHGEQCPKCRGVGHVESHRGFRVMRVSCPLCRGTGELGVEQEKEY